MWAKWEFRKNLTSTEAVLLAQELKRKRHLPGFAEAEINDLFIPRKRLKRAISNHDRPSLFHQADSTRASHATQGSFDTGHAIAVAPTTSISVWPALETPKMASITNDTPWFTFMDLMPDFVFDEVNISNTGTTTRELTQLLCLAERPVESLKLGELLSPNSFGSTSVGPGISVAASQVLKSFESTFLERKSGEFRESLAIVKNGSSFGRFLVMITYLLYIVCNNLGNKYTRQRLSGLFLLPATRPFVQALMRSSTLMAKAFLRQALVACCDKFDTTLLKTVIEYGADVNKVIYVEHDEPFTPLLHVLRHSGWVGYRIQYEFVTALLEAGADPNICKCSLAGLRNANFQDETESGLGLHPPILTHCYGHCRFSPLTYSARYPQAPGVIELLIRYGAVVSGYYDLTSAIRLSVCVEDVRALLKCLPSLAKSSTCDGDSISPLEAALTEAFDLCDSRVARLLLQHNSLADRPLMSGPLENSLYSRHSIKNDSYCLILALGQDDGEDIPSVLFAGGLDANACCWERRDHVDHLNDNDQNFVELGDYEHNGMGKWMQHTEDSGIFLPIQAAIASGCISRVKMVIAAGGEVACCHGTPPLVLAVRTGEIDLVELLIALGADINAIGTTSPMNAMQLSALAMASAMNKEFIVKKLLAAGANVNDCDSDHGLTPLQAAVLSRSYECVDLLMDFQATNVWHPGSTKTMIDAFVASILAEDAEVFKRLVQHPMRQRQTTTSGFNLHSMAIAAVQVTDSWFLNQVFTMGADLEQPDIILTASFSPANLQRLLSYGIRLERRSNGVRLFDTAFKHAVDECNFEVLEILIQQNICTGAASVKQLSERCDKHSSCSLASPSTQEEKEHTMLDTLLISIIRDCDKYYCEGIVLLTALLRLQSKWPCFAEKIPPVCKMLVEDTLNPHAGLCLCDRQALYWACKAGHRGMVELLLENGVLPTADHSCSAHGTNWEPALHVSTQNGHHEIMGKLIAHGADVNVPFGFLRQSPIRVACFTRDLEAVSILLRSGAKVNGMAEDYGVTVLMSAAHVGQSDILLELIAYGADVNTVASAKAYGKTALQFACEEGHLDVVKILIINHADINAPAGPNRGVTALQAAAIKGHGKICQILVERGADIAALASPVGGMTAIDGAAKYGRIDIVKYLLDNYEGNESITAVCDQARKAALENWQYIVVDMLSSYQRPPRG